LYIAQKEKLKEKSVKTSEVNVAKSDGNNSDSSAFSFSITLSLCYSDASEWLLNTGATYHTCLKREWFFNFEKLNSGVVIM